MRAIDLYEEHRIWFESDKVVRTYASVHDIFEWTLVTHRWSAQNSNRWMVCLSTHGRLAEPMDGPQLHGRSMGNIASVVYASCSRQMNHSNLVEFLGRSVKDGRDVIIMEYMEGGNLLEAVRAQEKPILVEEHLKLKTTLLGFAVQIADACSYLECKNCVHRDIAARNVLLTSMDFFSAHAKLGKCCSLCENSSFGNCSNF